jgi:hypothetical protein
VLTAPIFSAQGVAGAIAISGPTPRWNKETASEHVFEILESCGAISASLGHRGQTRATVGRHKFSTPPIEDASNSRDKTKKQAKNKIENEAD